MAFQINRFRNHSTWLTRLISWNWKISHQWALNVLRNTIHLEKPSWNEIETVSLSKCEYVKRIPYLVSSRVYFFCFQDHGNEIMFYNKKILTQTEAVHFHAKSMCQTCQGNWFSDILYRTIFNQPFSVTSVRSRR